MFTMFTMNIKSCTYMYVYTDHNLPQGEFLPKASSLLILSTQFSLNRLDYCMSTEYEYPDAWANSTEFENWIFFNNLYFDHILYLEIFAGRYFFEFGSDRHFASFYFRDYPKGAANLHRVDQWVSLPLSQTIIIGTLPAWKVY